MPASDAPQRLERALDVAQRLGERLPVLCRASASTAAACTHLERLAQLDELVVEQLAHAAILEQAAQCPRQRVITRPDARVEVEKPTGRRRRLAEAEAGGRRRSRLERVAYGEVVDGLLVVCAWSAKLMTARFVQILLCPTPVNEPASASESSTTRF